MLASDADALVALSDRAQQTPADDGDNQSARSLSPTQRRRGRAAAGHLLASKVQDSVALSVADRFEVFLENFKLPTAVVSSDGAFLQQPDSDRLSGTASGISESREQYITARPYLKQLIEMKAHGHNTLVVDFQHLMKWNSVLASAVTREYARLEPYLRRAVQNLIRKYVPSYLYVSASGASQASLGDSQLDPSQGGIVAKGSDTRDFWVCFTNLPVLSRLRELRTENVGQLTAISGTVTRTSEVRPELLFGSFECIECKTIVKEVEQQFKYTEPIMCQNSTCQNRLNWELLIAQSKFTDWQKVRVQESPNEIPSGAMPRSVDVILRNQMVEKAKAGDKVRFTGMLIVVPEVAQLSTPGSRVESQRGDPSAARGREGFNEGVTGIKALGAREMTYKLSFLACHVIPETLARSASLDFDDSEKSSTEVLMEYTREEIAEIQQMTSHPNIYNSLVKSIAPQVFGHDEIKRGILLQLMGGLHKKTPDGISLRGDINVCIVGDPSTSKSQFLKYVCAFMPRTVFTSGKASSAAGLTAAVVKDEETGEFTIEAGALMLADNGICAIDEFDKMDIRDQVAIHEAMEQQTISITKAGIQATLNARTSILAAANPVHGRYDKRLTLRVRYLYLFSRLYFSRMALLDECDSATDFNIARHIVNVHRFRDEQIEPEYPPEQVQRYIRYARTYAPEITPAAKEVLVNQYRMLRQQDASGPGSRSHRITVRQLESLIRLSEALARVHLDDQVQVKYVLEASRLLSKSIIHVESSDIELEDSITTHGGDKTLHELNSAIVDMTGLEDEDAFPPIIQSATMNGSNGGSDDNDVMMADRFQFKSTVNDKTASENVEVMTRRDQHVNKPKEKIKISAEEFTNIQNAVVLHLRSAEAADTEGLRRSDLIQWYLELVEEDLHTEEDLERKHKLIKLVLRHLVTKEHVLIEIRPSDEFGNPIESDDPFIMVHPNYVIPE